MYYFVYYFIFQQCPAVSEENRSDIELKDCEEEREEEEEEETGQEEEEEEEEEVVTVTDPLSQSLKFGVYDTNYKVQHTHVINQL